MALSSVSIEEYTLLYRQLQIPEEKRDNKEIPAKSLEEVLRMHGKRVVRNKLRMLEDFDTAKMISPFRSTLGSSKVKGVAISGHTAGDDLEALNWSDGLVLEVRSLIAAHQE